VGSQENRTRESRGSSSERSLANFPGKAVLREGGKGGSKRPDEERKITNIFKTKEKGKSLEKKGGEWTFRCLKV